MKPNYAEIKQKIFAKIFTIACFFRKMLRSLHKNLASILNNLAFMKTYITETFLSRGYQNPLPAMRIGNFPFFRNTKLLSFLLVLLLATNIISITWAYFRNASGPQGLYLADKAALYVNDLNSFETKVREVAARLDVPPEWLMAVMFSESRFDANAENFRGSGAVGLIQFMPATAKDLGTSTNLIGQLSHEEQLEWVYKYMQMIREKYGEYESLTDFYLAILYPKARRQEMCFSMYAHPTRAYKQNIGLDLDKNGDVTVGEIDKRMKKLYPTAYIKKKPSGKML